MPTTNSAERSRHRPTSVSGSDSQRPQIMRQLIGPFVQFAIGQLLIFKDHRDGIGGPLHLLLEQLMHAAVAGIVNRRVVPLHQQLMTFALASAAAVR